MKLKEERTIPNRRRESKNNRGFQICRLPCCPQGYFSVSDFLFPGFHVFLRGVMGAAEKPLTDIEILGPSMWHRGGNGEKVGAIWRAWRKSHSPRLCRHPWQLKAQTGVSYVLFAFNCSGREICVSARALALPAQGMSIPYRPWGRLGLARGVLRDPWRPTRPWVGKYFKGVSVYIFLNK